MTQMTQTKSRGRLVVGVSVSVLLAVVSLGLWLAPRAVAEPAGDKGGDLKSFMRKKLAASSTILEGLTVEDPDLIHDGATALLEMSRAEAWNVLLDEEYRDHSRDFRTAVKKLDQAAGDKNFDNALLQWLDAVKGCVECHRHVRDHRPQLKSR